LWLVLAMLLAAATACQRAGGPGGRAVATPSAPGGGLAGPATVQPTSATPTPTPRPLTAVSGDIFYRERIALPPDATVQVRVVRLGRPGAGRTVVAEQSFAAPRRVPIPFELECDPQALEARAAYGLEATISRRGKVEFATVEPVPVLAGGLSTRGLKILVRRTR
jgi:putative lipoprotein